MWEGWGMKEWGMENQRTEGEIAAVRTQIDVGWRQEEKMEGTSVAEALPGWGVGRALCAPGRCQCPGGVLLWDGTSRSHTPIPTVIDILSQRFSSHSAMYHPQAFYRPGAAGDSRPEHMTKGSHSWVVGCAHAKDTIYYVWKENWSRFVSIVRIVWVHLIFKLLVRNT